MQKSATPLTVVDFADIPALVGREFVGEWFQADLAHRELFEKGSYTDLSSPFAKTELLPKDVIHGFQLLSFLEYLMDGMLRTKVEQRSGYNYGFDKVRFTSVVSVRDRIRLVFTVTDVRPKDAGYVLTLDAVMEVEGRERPGYVAQWKLFWLNAEASAQ